MARLLIECLVLLLIFGATVHAGDEREQRSVVLALQVALDRAGFSPGVIDGRASDETRKALIAFQAAGHLPPTGTLDGDTIAGLGAAFTHPLTQHVLTPEDVRDSLAVVAARYHTTPALLTSLNPGRTFRPGERWTVPSVHAPGRSRKTQWWKASSTAGRADVTVQVSPEERAVRVIALGWTYFYAPFTVARGHEAHDWTAHDQLAGPHTCLELSSWDSDKIRAMAHGRAWTIAR